MFRPHLLIAILTIGLASLFTPVIPPGHAASGSYFDNVVIVAMENQYYTDVMGNGTGSSNAPFIASLLAEGATVPLYHAYGAAGRTVTGCSAGCYTALVSGSDQGISDGYNCCINAPTLMDRMVSAGLTWSAFCEDGCPRGNDHFPFTGFASISTSPNIHSSTGPLNPEFVGAMNAGSPANFIWLTPTDGHNMHSSSIQTGDSYLHDLLVGPSGSLANPATSSVLASNLFKAGHRTILMLWWDEFDPAPFLLYQPGIIKQSYISSSDSYDEFSILHTIENNWSLPNLTANDAAATVMTENFGPATSQPPNSSSGGTSGLLGLSNSLWLIIIGGLIGLVASLTLIMARARMKLKRAREIEKPRTTDFDTETAIRP